MKQPYYRIPVFNAGFYLFTGPSQRVKDFLEPRLLPCSYESVCRDLDECGGYSLAYTVKDGVENLLWVPDMEDSIVLFHEALHCGFNILKRVGVPADGNNQEAIAYLQGEIVRGARKVAAKYRYKDKAPGEEPAAGVAQGSGKVCSSHRISQEATA
ncbi:hypothetical protein KAM338_23680 [Aeromonas caviae]|jgi:hypothetical protein|uniref:Uncharacterized protein n=1 Tax=Aeromonas caviae TaxID=648 RepID=A0A6M4NSV3_AERCA|nr:MULTISPECIES: hypothetical protein [Aeromonas]QJR99834.1 Hypothetical protein [Aeromonas caviae]QMV81617.1 Hypothetical protein [Aeromonas caviae]UJQ39204.1 hypothetical protein L1871_22820 [Aeromonas caviae]BCK65754.1 hypothetical protein KAM330_47430 [Aeromonas hydrophila]GJA98214.1 hypothetical protein KAM359_16220 [Aeromonas caviae]